MPLETLMLKRYESKETGTFGELWRAGERICYTCEEPWRNNQRQISCIPAKNYLVLPYSSPKYPDAWEIQKVPNRDKILIHSGNTILDIEGCILVGSEIGTVGRLPGVINSRATFGHLKNTLPPSFYLNIVWGTHHG
jgi:hypothetical protein